MTNRSRLVMVALTVVAGVATAGSLYFSEVLGLVPCDLCWYQRILMYPLVVVLGVAAWENRPEAWRTALALSGLGVTLSAYHTYIQLTPAATCTVDSGCTAILWQAGPFTIPRLALVAFLFISVSLVFLAVSERS